VDTDFISAVDDAGGRLGARLMTLGEIFNDPGFLAAVFLCAVIDFLIIMLVIKK
jgi:hypothetical protein